jgi:hypothetical protein
VIVEVVAAEVGEGDGVERNAVEPALVEAVARSLHRDMVDPLLLEAAQRPVQGQRIGGREGAGFEADRRLDAQGAEAGGGDAGSGPDLAHERGDRGLAAGAGDGDGNLRLRGEHPGGGARIGGAHVGDHDHRHAGVRVERPVGDHHRRPRHDGGGDEGVAVDPGAGKGEEHRAGPDRAAVGRDPRNAQSRGRSPAAPFQQCREGERHPLRILACWRPQASAVRGA